MIYSKQILIDKIQEAIRQHPNSWHRLLKSKHFDLSIIESLDFYCPKVKGDEYKIMTKVYWLFNGLEDFPKCGNSKCNNTFEHHNVMSLVLGYRKNCCPQCAKDSDERKRLYAETCRKNYGVDNISQYEGTKRKKEQKALAKYGVKHVSQAPKVKALIASTNRDRYGASVYLASEQGIAQRRETCLEKYGVDSFSKTALHKEKMIIANRKNYGTDWPQQNRDFMRNMQKRYVYCGLNFDSSIELAVYIWCKDNNISFEYQPNKVFYYEYNGSQHAYEPDFIINGKFVEIKGDHFFKKDGTMQNPYDHTQDSLYEAKHQCMLQNNVAILTSKDYKKYIDYVKATYGKDYLKQFKNR